MPHCASKVVILATGGTIVSSGASATQMTGYSIQGLGVEDLLSAVPMLADVADVEAAQVSNIDSSSMTSEVWLKLANAVEEALRREDVSGVVAGRIAPVSTTGFSLFTTRLRKNAVSSIV